MKTNKKMMILSAIGIILVVLGHTRDQIKLVSDIFPYYSFHMVLFVFISGYFYNPKNEDKLLGKEGYIIKKIRKMLVPYFAWNLIYGIIGMVLRKLEIIKYGANINLRTFFIEPWLTGDQYVFNIAAWFLLALFLVNIVYILLRKASTKIKLWNDYISIIIFLFIAIFSIYFSQKNLNRNYIPLFRTGFFLFFYHLGYMYKIKIEGKIKVNTFIYFLILIVIQAVFIKLERNITYLAISMKFENEILITPIIVSCTGILFWAKIAEILVPSLGESKIVNYISNNTFDIMLHHLFFVFLLNILISNTCNIFRINGFWEKGFKNDIYYVYSEWERLTIFYTVVAIFMPLLFRHLYEKIKEKHI